MAAFEQWVAPVGMEEEALLWHCGFPVTLHAAGGGVMTCLSMGVYGWWDLCHERKFCSPRFHKLVKAFVT